MNYNDFELVSLAREHNEEATGTLYEKYKPIVLRKANDLYGRVSRYGLELNDLIQEGYIGLDNAINNYNENDNTSFYTFASLCVERQIMSFLRMVNTKKHRALNEAINLDDNMQYLFRDSVDIEKDFIKGENYKDIIEKLREKLSDSERIVFDYRMNGYSVSEIADKTKKSSKVIYNTLDRIKIKFRNLIQDK